MRAFLELQANGIIAAVENIVLNRPPKNLDNLLPKLLAPGKELSLKCLDNIFFVWRVSRGFRVV